MRNDALSGADSLEHPCASEEFLGSFMDRLNGPESLS